MSYRCSICPNVVRRGQPEKRHVIFREDGNILREIKVCHACNLLLEGGLPLARVKVIQNQSTAPPEPEKKPEYHPVALTSAIGQYIVRNKKVRK